MYRLLETIELVERMEDQIAKGLTLLAMKGASRDWYRNYPAALFKKGELLKVTALKGKRAYVEVEGTKRGAMVSVAALANMMGRKILVPLATGARAPYVPPLGFKKTPSTVPLRMAEDILSALLAHLDEEIAADVLLDFEAGLELHENAYEASVARLKKSTATLTPKRAKEIIAQAKKKTTIGPWSDQLTGSFDGRRPGVMTDREIEAVKRFWTLALPGNTSFVDALNKIARGQARKFFSEDVDELSEATMHHETVANRPYKGAPDFDQFAWQIKRKGMVPGPKKISRDRYEAYRNAKLIRDGIDMFNNARFEKRTAGKYYFWGTAFAAWGVHRFLGLTVEWVKSEGEGAYRADYWIAYRPRGQNIGKPAPSTVEAQTAKRGTKQAPKLSRTERGEWVNLTNAATTRALSKAEASTLVKLAQKLAASAT